VVEAAVLSISGVVVVPVKVEGAVDITPEERGEMDYSTILVGRIPIMLAAAVVVGIILALRGGQAEMAEVEKVETVMRMELPEALIQAVVEAVVDIQAQLSMLEDLVVAAL
jgi:hypothetical protein